MNTRISPSLAESSNPMNLQMKQLIKVIQGYEEKNNATAGMMNEMKKIVDEKLQALEKENNSLKEKTNVKDRTECT